MVVGRDGAECHTSRMQMSKVPSTACHLDQQESRGPYKMRFIRVGVEDIGEESGRT